MAHIFDVELLEPVELASILPTITEPADGVLAYDPDAGTLRVCSQMTVELSETVVLTVDGAYSWMGEPEPTDHDWLMLAENILNDQLS